jgi:hypothetical protein
MSTRDDARRDLRDLAKRASAVPTDRPSESQQLPANHSGGWTGSHITVPPAIASVPARRPPAPISTGSLSYPTRRASWPVAVFRTAFGEGSGWRGIWSVLAGGTLAAAMVGGVLLGQSLTSRLSPESGAEPSANANASRPEAETPPAPSVPGTAAAATPEIPTLSSPTALPVSVEGSVSPNLRAPHAPPPHHVEFRQLPPRPVIVIAPPPNTAAAKAPPAKPPAARTNPQDALDELIRKAASGN